MNMPSSSWLRPSTLHRSLGTSVDRGARGMGMGLVCASPRGLLPWGEPWRSLSWPPETLALLRCCSCCFSLAISLRCSALPHDAERLWLLPSCVLWKVSAHESGVWVDLSLRHELPWPSSSLGQCPCRYGPTMASRETVRLIPELCKCALDFPASLRLDLGLQAN